LVLCISHWRIKDDTVLKKDFLVENDDIFIFFFRNLELFENQCHTTRVAEQTLEGKGKKSIFGVSNFNIFVIFAKKVCEKR